MRKLIAGFVFLVLALLLSALALQDAPDPWQIVAPGIAYQEFHLPAPNNMYVARMDRSNPNVTIDSSLAQGRLSGAMETVRGMAARYDEAINYLGWVLGCPKQGCSCYQRLLLQYVHRYSPEWRDELGMVCQAVR